MTYALELQVSDPVSRFIEEGVGIPANRDMVFLESEWLDYLTRSMKAHDLFLCYHKGTKAYVVGLWLVRPECGCPSGVVLELETMNGHPDYLPGKGGATDRPSLEYMKSRIRPVADTRSEADRMAAKRRSNRISAQVEYNERRADRVKFLERRGYDEAARKIATGEHQWQPLTAEDKE